MAGFLLVITGYATALLAMVVAFVERRRKLTRSMRHSLVLLAAFSGITATLHVVMHRGSKIPGDLAALAVYGPLLPAYVVCWIVIAWWFVSTLFIIFESRKLAERPDIDFSFLNSNEKDGGIDTSTGATSPQKKLDYWRWIPRLQKLKVLHRWSFLSDPP